MKISVVLRDYIFVQKIARVKKLNGIYDFLQKLPLIGKHLPNRFYNAIALKTIWNGVLLGLQLIWRPFGAALTLGICYLGATLVDNGLFSHSASLFSKNTATLDLTIGFWFILSPVLAHGLTSLFRSIDKQSSETMTAFRLDRFSFFAGQSYLDLALTMVSYLPSFILLAIFTPVSSTLLWNSYGALLALSLAGEGRERLVAQKYHGHNQSYLELLWFVPLVILMIAFLIFQDYQQTPLLLGTYPVTGLMVLLILGYFGVRKHTSNTTYITYLIESDQPETTGVENEKDNKYLAEGLTLQKELKLAPDQSSMTALNGNQSINQLLFKRYRPVLRKGLLIRLELISIIGIGLTIAEALGVVHTTSADFIKTIPALFFLMYLASYGKNIVQMCFVNCDRAMLYYPFYRESHVIRAGLFYRFGQVLRYNGAISGLTWLMLVLVMRVSNSGLSWPILRLLALVLVSLTLLFSFHELFVYYLLQPFTGDMHVVNPIYKVVSGILYWISYLNLRIATGTYRYALILALAAFAYVVIGAVIISRRSPQTFRIKSNS